MLWTPEYAAARMRAARLLLTTWAGAVYAIYWLARLRGGL